MSDFSILDRLDRASAAVADQLDAVGRLDPGLWAAPTPCTEWTVRDLAGHLVGIDLRLLAMFEEGPPPERGVDRLGDDPAGAYRRSAAALRAAAVPGALERSGTTPIGVATGAERLQWRVADLLVHSWDLAQATGVRADLPDGLVEPALAFVGSGLAEQDRTGRFGEPQPIGDGAPVLDRLAAFTGRPVPWRP